MTGFGQNVRQRKAIKIEALLVLISFSALHLLCSYCNNPGWKILRELFILRFRMHLIWSDLSSIFVFLFSLVEN